MRRETSDARTRAPRLAALPTNRISAPDVPQAERRQVHGEGMSFAEMRSGLERHGRLDALGLGHPDWTAIRARGLARVVWASSAGVGPLGG